MVHPIGLFRVQEGARVVVQGTGSVYCYSYPPNIDSIPPLTGSSDGRAFTVELSGYQTTGGNAGPLVWHLTQTVAGLTIDPNTGTLTVAEGFGVSSSDGSIGVYAEGVAGRSNVAPLRINVSGGGQSIVATVPGFRG